MPRSSRDPGTDFPAAVLAAVSATSVGDVVTYGEIAAQVGAPLAARAVGRVLAGHGAHVPWWRVVTASGRLAPGKETVQAAALAREGVVCRDDHVVACSTTG